MWNGCWTVSILWIHMFTIRYQQSVELNLLFLSDTCKCSSPMRQSQVNAFQHSKFHYTHTRTHFHGVSNFTSKSECLWSRWHSISWALISSYPTILHIKRVFVVLWKWSILISFFQEKFDFLWWIIHFPLHVLASPV